jgi:endonuclease/exonuclease/phosphatase (EEP) superfamily protein YafD
VRRAAARVVGGLGVLGLLAGGTATLARYVPPTWPPGPPDAWGVITAFTDLGVLGYLLALLGLGGSLLLKFSTRRLVLGGVAVVLAVVQISWIVPRFVPAPRGTPTAPVTIFSLNMQFGRADAGEIVRATQQADLVVLTEATEPARQRLLAEGLGRRFRYEIAEALPTGGAAGTTVFSRFPILHTEPLPAAIDHQNWLVTVQLPVIGAVVLAAVHPAKPGFGTSIWTSDSRLLRASLPHAGPVVVSGDFNAVESHWPMRRLREDGFRSSTDLAGAGWQPTWPADRPRLPPVVDIDHILLSPDLTAYKSWRVRIDGSDHLAIAAVIDRRGA